MSATPIRSSTLPLLKYTRTRILESRDGFYVELRPNGVLQSTSDIKSPFIFLQFLTVGTNMVAIWGVDSRLYLAIDEDGTVFTTKAESKECVFKEYVTKEFFNRYQTCHKNEDELAWNLCMTKDGKIIAKLAAQSPDRSLDFMVKLPAEQAVFYRPLFSDHEQKILANKQGRSHASKITDSSSQRNNSTNAGQNSRNGSVIQRTFTPRAVVQSDSQSSSDSQYSQSERSYPFTDSMEIMRFTSDSSLESFQGM